MTDPMNNPAVGWWVILAHEAELAADNHVDLVGWDSDGRSSALHACATTAVAIGVGGRVVVDWLANYLGVDYDVVASHLDAVGGRT